MNRQRSYKMNPSVAATAMLVLLIVICLTEGASEQRINSRGNKSPNIIPKVNGWRSQRGGSCLSYGHSCWGAHGKRSGRQSSSAADLYLNRILSRMASNDMTRGKTYDLKNDDFDDIFRVVVEDPSNRLTSYIKMTIYIFIKKEDGENVCILGPTERSGVHHGNLLIIVEHYETMKKANRSSESEEPVVDMSSKLPEAKPMLDDDLISKMKLWQLMVIEALGIIKGKQRHQHPGVLTIVALVITVQIPVHIRRLIKYQIPEYGLLHGKAPDDRDLLKIIERGAESST
ncbi:uncharacterized protein LOC126974307 [Leptidea sinapis]|uniref:uncharacterized protein LOC126974307 n=1 Tax=Leptidea sinapis TaxID=189913 RepID=UPI0021C3ED38|nr:uncharacterized protein LOC126974307 [Leptidea sinapis]